MTVVRWHWRSLLGVIFAACLLVSAISCRVVSTRGAQKDYKAERFTLRSKWLPEAREITVFVPPGYADDSKNRYPVLYLQDGWQVQSVAQSLIESGEIEPLILVSVPGGKHRLYEFTPTRDKRRKDGGGADGYLKMLVGELKPQIDSRYRTRPGAAATGIGGFSLGALVSLCAGERYPKAFGKLALISPSLWWDDHLLVHRVEKLPAKLPLKIWLSAGTNEKGMLADNERFHKVLLAKGWRQNKDERFVKIEGGKHDIADFSRTVAPMLRFLFPPQQETDKGH